MEKENEFVSWEEIVPVGQTKAIEELTEAVENGCGADVLLRLGQPVLVRTTGPKDSDRVTYDPAFGEALAKELCTVLMPKLGLIYEVSSVAPGQRVISYRHPGGAA